MDFKKISINGVDYGHSRAANLDHGIENVDFHDPLIYENMKHSDHSSQIENTLLFLSLCHTVLVEPCGESLKYNASSPDELALLNFAKYMEYEYQGMDIDNNISLKVKGENVEGKYRLLHVLEFNSTRKR